MTPPLPSLSKRATRIRLLAWTYHDAVQGKPGGGGSHGRLESCIPSRNGELWDRGSYRDLERAMDELRQRDRVLAGIFEKLHVYPADWLRHGAGPAVTAIDGLMPEMILVPASVMLAAGYLAGDARAFARRWDADEEFGKKEAA